MRNLEGNVKNFNISFLSPFHQASNEERSPNLDVPDANITVKQEIPDWSPNNTNADWAISQEIKREIFGSFTEKKSLNKNPIHLFR